MSVLCQARRVGAGELIIPGHGNAAHHVDRRPIFAEHFGDLLHARPVAGASDRLLLRMADPAERHHVVSLAEFAETLEWSIHVPERDAIGPSKGPAAQKRIVDLAGRSWPIRYHGPATRLQPRLQPPIIRVVIARRVVPFLAALYGGIPEAELAVVET